MDTLDEIGTCEFCNHKGPKEGFYSSSKRFCTAACSHSFSAKHRFNKPGKTPSSTSSKNSGSNNPDVKAKSSDSKNKSNRRRFVLPSESRRHQCISMGFDWGAYLSSKKANAASVDLFNHSPMSPYWGDIGNGMKVEVLNLDCNLSTKVYWIASVVQLAGYKAKLRYEGFGEDSSCDFWCNLCTLDVNAVGWCATIGKPLVPPQTIQHKYSNWKSFLVKKLTGAKTLPSDFQKQITESVKSPFMCGVRLEVVDKTRISQMRVGVVNEVIGGRLRLKYEDADYENDDFWCHSQSSLVHPIGWSERVGHSIFVLSKDYKIKKGLKNARQELFAPVRSVKSCGFKINMKLEAIDPLNLSAICVATVKRVLRNGYLMIGIDGSEAVDGADWFCYHCTAPSIFPVGFCMQNKISLSVPTKYKDNFSWEDYLSETRADPAPVELFENTLPDHGFKAGMRLEAVDLMEPRLICVATVTKIVGRLLHVHFDGWENQYDQWVDCESPDIFPVGWCELVGFELQPPPNMINTVDQNASKKKKSKGQSFVTKKKRKKTLNILKKLPTESSKYTKNMNVSQVSSSMRDISSTDDVEGITKEIISAESYDASSKPDDEKMEDSGFPHKLSCKAADPDNTPDVTQKTTQLTTKVLDHSDEQEPTEDLQADAVVESCDQNIKPHFNDAKLCSSTPSDEQPDLDKDGHVEPQLETESQASMNVDGFIPG